jgi:hypothetical protein
MALMRLFALFLFVLPASADIQFTPRRTTNTNLPRGKGECDIRLTVDDAVEVSVHRDRVEVHNITGSDARDEGSECSGPMPDRDFEGFRFEVKEKRNEIRLSEPPSARNGFRAVVFIRDSAPGEGRYAFRISWKTPPPAPPPGMSFNNAVHSAARGHGEARLDDNPGVTLVNAAVDYDTAGNILVVLTPVRGEPVTFSGTVMSFDRNVMKAGVVADERFAHLRGPMYLYFDDKHQVFKIELHATDGQQRLTLNWQSGK